MGLLKLWARYTADRVRNKILKKTSIRFEHHETTYRSLTYPIFVRKFSNRFRPFSRHTPNLLATYDEWNMLSYSDQCRKCVNRYSSSQVIVCWSGFRVLVFPLGLSSVAPVFSSGNGGERRATSSLNSWYCAIYLSRSMRSKTYWSVRPTIASLLFSRLRVDKIFFY